MTKFYETEEFKALEKEWYKKIKEEGFKDLEPRWNRDSLLSGSTRPTERAKHANTEEYYTLARQALHTDLFVEGSIEHQIWALHSEGISIRKIMAKLNVPKRFVCNVQAKGVKHIKALSLTRVIEEDESEANSTNYDTDK